MMFQRTYLYTVIITNISLKVYLQICLFTSCYGEKLKSPKRFFQLIFQNYDKYENYLFLADDESSLGFWHLTL